MSRPQSNKEDTSDKKEDEAEINICQGKLIKPGELLALILYPTSPLRHGQDTDCP